MGRTISVGIGRFFQGVAAVAGFVVLGSCSPLIGVGVTGAAVSAAALTRGCHDYYDVSVFDGRTANRTCSADVVARERGGREFTLTSCYYAALSDGVWTITARAAGFVDDATEVVVRHDDGCTPQTGTIELTLNPAFGSLAPVPAPPAQPRPPTTATAPVPAPPVPAPAPASSAPQPAPTAPSGSSRPQDGWFPPVHEPDAGVR